MRRYGLIGRPLGHSASAAYFAAKFEREGIADCAYALYELPDIGALEGLLARTPDLCGFNVTIPYKREVMPLLDALSHDARMIGAVNCVRRAADGSLTGHNTDVVGTARLARRTAGRGTARTCAGAGDGRRFAGRAVCVGRARNPVRSGVARHRRRATIPTTICRAKSWSGAV